MKHFFSWLPVFAQETINLLEFCLSKIDTCYNMLVINVKQRHLDNKSIYFNWKVFFSKLFLKKTNITHYYSFKILLCF